MVKKEITVQELIDLLNAIPNKDCPIDICRQGCYGEKPKRHKIVPVIRKYKSDLLGREAAYSIEALRGSKLAIECDIVDGYEPLTLEDCKEDLVGLDEEGKETVLDAINLHRRNNQHYANLAARRGSSAED